MFASGFRGHARTDPGQAWRRIDEGPGGGPAESEQRDLRSEGENKREMLRQDKEPPHVQRNQHRLKASREA
jgi:hypothetical protein